MHLLFLPYSICPSGVCLVHLFFCWTSPHCDEPKHSCLSSNQIATGRYIRHNNVFSSLCFIFWKHVILWILFFVLQPPHRHYQSHHFFFFIVNSKLFVGRKKKHVAFICRTTNTWNYFVKTQFGQCIQQKKKMYPFIHLIRNSSWMDYNVVVTVSDVYTTFCFTVYRVCF